MMMMMTTMIRWYTKVMIKVVYQSDELDMRFCNGYGVLMTMGMVKMMMIMMTTMIRWYTKVMKWLRGYDDSVGRGGCGGMPFPNPPTAQCDDDNDFYLI